MVTLMLGDLQMPWLKINCHSSLENDAPTSEIVSKKMPMLRQVRVPHLEMMKVANGAIRSAWLMDRPPMKAYASADVPGKAFEFK
jgi:hypothetical protein